MGGVVVDVAWENPSQGWRRGDVAQVGFLRTLPGIRIVGSTRPADSAAEKRAISAATAARKRAPSPRAGFAVDRLPAMTLLFPLRPAMGHRPGGRIRHHGEVAEWSNVRDWKSRVPETVPRVRIPPSPPSFASAQRTRRMPSEASTQEGPMHPGNTAPDGTASPSPPRSGHEGCPPKLQRRRAPCNPATSSGWHGLSFASAQRTRRMPSEASAQEGPVQPGDAAPDCQSPTGAFEGAFSFRAL